MENQIVKTRSMNGIDPSAPYYVTRVYLSNGEAQKEFKFQELDFDLMRSRAKAFARMEFEIQKDVAKEIEVLICNSFNDEIVEHKLKSLSEGSDRDGLHQEILIHNLFGCTDWTEIEEMYDEEIENLEEAENMKLQALKAVDKIEEALQEIYACESIFIDDQFLFDWVSIMSARAKLLKGEIQDKIDFRLNSAA
ncbi:hypothetical protein FHS59_002745 [Algoriphagus iocasae]|uniref:Uncharacterized protein n=1 Tax=Algoriphagus iocasae TaxID=1836499 RepID=A0A841MNN0_9BACT|nr:hypothetical protein [Algoriphagus iocasae]MBB6327117.1 hypothetical protein [Algoriphagus iocasae]